MNGLLTDAGAIPERAVLVFAHPDDELTVAGTVARLTDAGTEVALVCATNGAGGAGSAQQQHQDLALVRRRELQASCDALGIGELVLLEDPGNETHLGQSNYRSAMPEHERAVRHLLDRIAPDLLITFGPDGITGHPTHVMVGQVARRAAQSMSTPPEVLQVAYSV